jgi:hypothetical protein
VSTLGTASVSIVSLRAKASDSSEQTSQILAGEGVRLLEEGRGDWVKIKSLEDGYVGWCDKKQFRFDVDIPEERIVLCHPMSQWKNERTLATLWIPAGSLIEERDGSQFLGADKISPNQPHTSKDDIFGTIPMTMRDAALSMLGAPYQWGGRTIAGIDCSGLSQLAARLTGKLLPRDASEQFNCGDVVEWDLRESDDLAFFENNDGLITHVGILVTRDSIVHASGEVRIDLFTKEGIVHAEIGGLTHRLNCIKRLQG